MGSGVLTVNRVSYRVLAAWFRLMFYGLLSSFFSPFEPTLL